MHVRGQAHRYEQPHPPPNTRSLRETTGIRVEGERGVAEVPYECQLAANNQTKLQVVRKEPLARCEVMRDVCHMHALSSPTERIIIVGLVNVQNKVSILSIDLEQVCSIKHV